VSLTPFKSALEDQYQRLSDALLLGIRRSAIAHQKALEGFVEESVRIERCASDPFVCTTSGHRYTHRYRYIYEALLLGIRRSAIAHQKALEGFVEESVRIDRYVKICIFT